MEGHFASAAVSTGTSYLGHEVALRLGGQPAIDVLGRHLKDSDPIVRLLARVLLPWARGRKAEYDLALAHLDNLPTYLASTPAGQPRPSMVRTYLTEEHGPRLAELIALRLVKEASPRKWRVLGFVLYLGDQRVHSTSEALIRFAAETQDETWRSFAVKALASYGDPNLPRKIRAEANQARAAGRDLPSDLKALAQRH